MIKRISLLCALLVVVIQLNAQKRLLSGQVVEEGSGASIPYATLIIKNTIYGAQADEDGKYTLELPAGYEQDSISVSSLSYKPQTFAVIEMTKNQRIELELDVNLLGEVVVYPIKAEDILKKASENRDKNHKIEKSTVQQSFTRELFFDNGKCFRVGENIVNVYSLNLPKDTLKNKILRKTMKSRAIQDSVRLWVFNDMFRMKHDTISLDESFSREISGLDITSILGKANSEVKNEQKENSQKRKKRKATIGLDFSSDFKYNGTLKVLGRTTHRILVELSHKKKTIIKGQVLIDSATYAFSQVQLANQNVDLYKEFVPWYIKGVLRLMGYKPVINCLSISSSYAIGKNGKWYKTYDYFRFGGLMKKHKHLLDAYAETECFYTPPKVFQGNANKFYKANKKGEDFKENFVTSFDDDEFWKPYKSYPTPEKVKKLVSEIHENNQLFEGSIGYNKQESRKRRREERRKR